MAVSRTTSTFRPDGGGGDDGRGLRRYHSQVGVRIGGRRPSKRLPSIEGTSVTAKQAGSSKFLLIGAVLAIQFVGAAASFSRGNDIKVDFEMSKEAVVNSSIDLKCEWVIPSGSRLYSVKWYKDEHEFYKYLPDNEKSQIFFRPGVTDVKERQEKGPKHNSQKSITLQNLNLASAGQYKCEVSLEGPSFATNFQTVNLTIISPPERGPEITGLSTHYALGENVTANCTAWPSVPKANLRWTINDEPVRREDTVQNPPLMPIGNGGIPNSLGLWLEAEQRHFTTDGMINVKCIAEVGSQVYVAEKKVTMAYVNRQRLSAGDHLNSAARIIRAGFLNPLAIFALVLLTT